MNHLIDNGEHQGISILGFDEEAKKLFTKSFDNLGFERKYTLENENNKWKFSGDKERATREFSNDGKSYTEHWEIKKQRRAMDTTMCNEWNKRIETKLNKKLLWKVIKKLLDKFF